MTRAGAISLVWIIVTLVSASGAIADTKLELDYGWGQHLRAGAWTPVFVTLSDSRSRNVVLELRSPGSEAMLIRQRVAIGPEPATFPLLAPLTYALHETTLTVRDAESGRTLVSRTFTDEFGGGPNSNNKQVLQSNDPLLAVSGRGPAMQALTNYDYGSQKLNVDYLQPSRLPAVAEGYTALDALVLNQPNLDPSGAGARGLRFEQQQAIIEWVRAGGNLILWPGVDPLPASSPIVSALPCAIADFQPLAVSPDVLSQFGLAARFADLQHRPLIAATEAETFPILGDSGATACRKRIGFGSITVLSVDVSSLQFDSTSAAGKFWEPILAHVVEKIEQDATTQPYYYQNTIEQRHAAAVLATMDVLGDVPGVGSFGFSYVAIVLIALMLVVGPVDWFVLKKLNRQPWTWATTTGWIALVTCGALYVGHVFKSGDLHLRTLRLIDQADGQTVANIDFACIYSPRTTDYELKVDEQTWFRPPDMGNYYSAGLTSETPFHQDYRGNRPEKMRINVWNLKFVMGQKIERGPAMIDAKLAIASNGHVTGTIKNLSEHAIKFVLIRIAKGQCMLAGPIGPGASAAVDLPVESLSAEFRDEEDPNGVGYYGAFDAGKGLSDGWCGFLSSARSRQINAQVKSRTSAYVYAEFADPMGVGSLTTAGAIERHWRVVRALVPLEAAEESP